MGHFTVDLDIKYIIYLDIFVRIIDKLLNKFNF